MTRILASDILIADVIVPLEGNARLKALVEKYQLQPGGKRAISREMFEEFSDVVSDYAANVAPGGSSANVLTTLARMLDDVEVDFLGAIDGGAYSAMIRRSLEEARVRLLPEAFAPGVRPETAVSYVMMFPGGQRTIATYPGNAREALSPEMITPQLVQSCDAALIQGSLWAKMGSGYAGRLYRLCREYNKEIWLALPTYSLPKGEHVEVFREAIDHAALVLGNEEELSRIYGMGAQDALAQLQRVFQNEPSRAGFITTGDKGAVLLTSEGMQTIAPVRTAAVVNTLGAGDTAFAGFLAGHLLKKPHRECATIAMALAAEKLSVNAARLGDPKAVWEKICGSE